jgi:hypothetical protein
MLKNHLKNAYLSPHFYNSIYLVITIVVILGLLHNHYQMIISPIPLDYNEAAQPTITATITSGENPYTIKNQPARSSVYPVLYNIIVAPLTKIFGNTLELHRSVVAIFIWASCLLCYAATYKQSKSIPNSLACATLYYAALLFYSTPIASPNSLGLFFFLASIFTPWAYNFSNKSLAVALIFGILAFYGKQYFIASLGYLALYLFIAVSKKKGLIFGVFSLFTLILSLIAIHRKSPYFLDNTIFSVKTATSIINSNQVMLNQIKLFIEYYSPLITIFTVLAIFIEFNWVKIKNIFQRSNKTLVSLINLKDIDTPLLSKSPNYIFLCFLCSVSIIVLILGKNPANHMTYLFQLISPFFLIILFTLFSRWHNAKWLLLPFITFNLYYSYNILPKNFTFDTEKWSQLEYIMSENNEIYGSPIILGSILNDNKTIYQNGHTIYFSFANGKPKLLKKANDQATVKTIWEKYIAQLYKNIETQKFDLIILDRWTRIPNPPLGSDISIKGIDHLKQYYEKSEKISLSLIDRPGGGVYKLNIWRRKEK